MHQLIELLLYVGRKSFDSQSKRPLASSSTPLLPIPQPLTEADAS